MDDQSGYEAGGTAGGKCGCLAAAIVGAGLLPILGLFFMGDCAPNEQCQQNDERLLLGGLLLIAAVATAVGLSSRVFINRFIAWNHKPREMTPEEAAALLRRCIDDTATAGEIDYFISVDIVDPVLDDVKDEVGVLYGPGWDDEETKARLREQLQRVEELIRPPRA